MSIRLVRWTIVAALGLLVALAAVAVGSRTPTLRKLVIQTLARLERLDSEVELGAFSVDTFPTVHITGRGLVIRHKNSRDVPPLVSVDSFAIDGGLFGLSPRTPPVPHGHRDRAPVNIPPGGFKSDRKRRPQDTAPRTDDLAARTRRREDHGPGAIVVDRLVAENAALVLIPRRADKQPKIFDVHRLTMEPLGRGSVMSYKADPDQPASEGARSTRAGRSVPGSGRIPAAPRSPGATRSTTSILRR